jgi:hypothetical protein
MASDFFHAVIMLRTELMGECGDTCRCIGSTWRSRGTGVGVQPSKSFACVRTFVPGVGPHSVATMWEGKEGMQQGATCLVRLWLKIQQTFHLVYII